MTAPVPPPTPLRTLSQVFKTQGEISVRPIGLARSRLSDIYHDLLRASWTRLLVMFFATFLIFNLIFALLFWLDPRGVGYSAQQIDGQGFWRAFVFSVDTMATVGYGNMYPLSVYANVVAVIEIALGILFVALVTGVAFARFSRPTARILFSKVAVIAPFDGVPTLMFRTANQRHNLIYEASANVSVLADVDVGGTSMRRFSDLTLVRSRNPVFALSWTLMHPIDADSPLFAWLAHRGAVGEAEIIVVLSGTDERTGQAIHARWACDDEDVVWDARFVDIIGTTDGTRTIDYRKFHDVIPVDGEAAASLGQPS
ncbi:MAG: ion channel [Sphingomicrobium sp.]